MSPCALPRIVSRTTRPAPDVLSPSNIPRMNRMAWSPPACTSRQFPCLARSYERATHVPSANCGETHDTKTRYIDSKHLRLASYDSLRTLTLPVGYFWQSHDCGKTVSMAPKKTARCEPPRASVLNA
jgi:hypothetical protein